MNLFYLQPPDRHTDNFTSWLDTLFQGSFCGSSIYTAFTVSGWTSDAPPPPHRVMFRTAISVLSRFMSFTCIESEIETGG